MFISVYNLQVSNIDSLTIYDIGFVCGAPNVYTIC